MKGSRGSTDTQGAPIDSSIKALIAYGTFAVAMQAWIRCRFNASLPGTRVWNFAKMAGMWVYAPPVQDANMPTQPRTQTLRRVIDVFWPLEG